MMFLVNNPTVEYRREPLGVENRRVRFGFQVRSGERDFQQAAYRIRVATDPAGFGEPDCWDSGFVASDRSENIEYGGKPLQAETVYYFQVTVRGGGGEEAETASRFETALYDENFTAKWIAQPKARAGWASYLRRGFRVAKKVKRARLYACGLGVGEAWLNGARVSDCVLEPMITNFEKLVEYAVYDVTDRLVTGENAVGMILGDGFYNQNRVWCDGTLFYGANRMRMELHLFYEDGTRDVIGSDESFLCDYSPITLNNVYGGETYDARLEQDGWCCPGFRAEGWKPAVEMPAPGGKLVCREMPPIRRTRRVLPVRAEHLHKGEADQTWIVDMGQNFAGWVRIHIPYSPAGAEYVLRFAERADGGMDYETCGAFHTCLVQQDRYIARGEPGGETFEPRFTYHGFQYVEVTGVNKMSTELPENFLEGFAVNTDLEEAGNFTSSYSPVNRLQELGVRTIRSNYHGIPEDCPVREKCGWLGDAQLVSEAAIYNFNMVVCYEKYLEDIRTTKEVYGTWQMIAPGKRTCGDASPLWGCAQVVLPWNLYMYYGDRRALECNYDAMKEWVLHEKARSEGLVISAGLGDWCPPGDNEGNPERIPVAFSSTAEFFHVASIMTRVAALLNQAEDEAMFRSLAAEIRAAVNTRFLDRAVPSYGTMGADGVALAYGICPEDLRDAVARDCARILNVRCGGGFRTGIYGNKYMVPAMTEMGYGDDMLAALFNPRKASFATMMANGAASVWECFDDKRGWETFRGGESSMNHPMQFAFASWFYSHILGIRPLEEAPGFKEFLVRPYPLAELKEASGSHETLYGTVVVGWKMDYETFTLRLVVPANTLARCELPVDTARKRECGEDGRKVEKLQVLAEGRSLDVPFEERDGRLCFRLGGGSYRIICR